MRACPTLTARTRRDRVKYPCYFTTAPLGGGDVELIYGSRARGCGADATLDTQVLGRGTLTAAGVWRGDLYLRGSGDPTFGSSTFTQYDGGRGTSVDTLAEAVAEAGITRVSGRVYGDESLFDTIRGVHDSGYHTSPWIGPLSALTLNHGYDGNRFQSNPPTFAADVLRKTLKADGISPGHAAARQPAPSGAKVIASVTSPPMATLVKLTNKDSDNFFAETLLKDIGRDASGVGTTSAGVSAVRSFASSVGARVSLIDGSGLDHWDRAAPRDVVRLLMAERSRPEFQALYDSLPIAGVDGTLDDRMRSGPAKRNCHAKTGSLIAVMSASTPVA